MTLCITITLHNLIQFDFTIYRITYFQDVCSSWHGPPSRGLPCSFVPPRGGRVHVPRRLHLSRRRLPRQVLHRKHGQHLQQPRGGMGHGMGHGMDGWMSGWMLGHKMLRDCWEIAERFLDVPLEESPMPSFHGWFILDFWYRPRNWSWNHLSFTWKLHPALAILADLRSQFREFFSVSFPAHVWFTGWRPYMEDFHFAMHSLGGDWSDTAAFGVSGFDKLEVCLFSWGNFGFKLNPCELQKWVTLYALYTNSPGTVLNFILKLMR